MLPPNYIVTYVCVKVKYLSIVSGYIVITYATASLLMTEVTSKDAKISK